MSVSETISVNGIGVNVEAQPSRGLQIGSPSPR
jgi:hypothetical protein